MKMLWLFLAVFSVLLKSTETRSLGHPKDCVTDPKSGQEIINPEVISQGVDGESSSIYKRDGAVCLRSRDADDDDEDETGVADTGKRPPKPERTQRSGVGLLNWGQGYNTFLARI
ncbi:hypothetical protein HRG_014744 [Hirsutella rhossiliensis]